MKPAPILLMISLAFSSPAALAHGGAKHEPKPSPASTLAPEQMPWGIAGEAASAQRTITLEMSDAMRFSPALIEAAMGETLRIRLRNSGALMHEMVIGTPEVLDEHAAMMKRFPNMEHDEPYMTHVAPGETGEIVWTFNRAGEFDYGCLIGGHYEAGMTGKIRVTE